ncbi:MAG: HAD-IIIA family hydrolase [Candidatus Omnitrophota bacterium]|jgi:3-deoxy-D-manno-octulosonate 8-phosphate phosphatase (KDO 8-P phosphatase)
MIEEKAKKIKLLILDVDGVLTDGRIVYDNFNNEMKFFNVHDGFGMALLYRAGIKSAIITARGSGAVKRRAKDMHVAKVYSGHKKLEIYESAIKKFMMKDDEVCFMGDDLIDLPVLKRVGLSIAPPEAAEEVKRACHYITKKGGGKGAVREVAEIILKSQGLWDKAIKEYTGDPA